MLKVIKKHVFSNIFYLILKTIENNFYFQYNWDKFKVSLAFIKILYTYG